jgi:hypothetical protein
MTAMRISYFAVVCCLALAACDHQPTFDASSLPAYQKSLGEIKARLSGNDQHKLQIALMTLVAGSTADFSAFAEANPPAVVNFESLDGFANPLAFLDRMRPAIQGKSAASVIRHVADDLDFAISRAQEQANGGAEKALAAFVIEHARFSWDRRNRNIQPIVEFSVYNGSRNSISAIYLSSELTTPDRDMPLVMGDVNYRFVNPLQPGAQQEVKVFLVVPGPWMAKQLETAYDRELKLKVSNIDDSNGKRLLSINIGRLDVMRKKRDALRAS